MHESFVGTILLLLTGFTTYKALVDAKYMEDNIFDVDKILMGREFKRIISSGFLHANWYHFAFNMIALLGFSYSLEIVMGRLNFALIYFISMIGGSLLALYIHRNHGDYRALGASGAISGIVLASIVLDPLGSISFILIPGSMPSWVFGLLFIAISIFGIKSKLGNIGHEAHLGGAIVGVLTMLAFQPSLIFTNWWIIILVLLPPVVFLWMVVKKPEILMIDKYWGVDLKRKVRGKRKVKIANSNLSKEQRMNALLEKIKKGGMESLTTRERRELEELS